MKSLTEMTKAILKIRNLLRDWKHCIEKEQNAWYVLVNYQLGIQKNLKLG
jgi:hypothetical protein